MEISTVYLLCRHIIRASPTKEVFTKPSQVTDKCFVFTQEVREWFLRMSIPNCTRCSSHMVPLSPRRLRTCGGSPPPRGLVCKRVLHPPPSVLSLPSRSSIPIGTFPMSGICGAPAPAAQASFCYSLQCLPWLCFCPGPFLHPSQEAIP